MFGIAIARMDQVSEDEKQRYEAIYCGTCRSLKDRYGNLARLTLNYDLTFLVLLENSLNDQPEQEGLMPCPAHPMKKMPYVHTAFTERAADLCVALAYHKCLDDVDDIGGLQSKAKARALKRAYERAFELRPTECALIDRSLRNIKAFEDLRNTSLDSCANEFGNLLGGIFAEDQTLWSESMHDLGYHLGKFIYLMDAALDIADDRESGSYNPFLESDLSPETIHAILSNLIGCATTAFEKLPLERDLHLMRSVLYSGVWQKHNRAEATNEDGSLDR